MNSIEKATKTKGQIFTFDDGQLRTHVAEVVRQNVEETLNALLDAEAEELCKVTIPPKTMPLKS